MTEKIPGPRGLPIVGNLYDLLKHENGVLAAMEDLADIYGELYSVTIKGEQVLMASSARALLELTDEKRFMKSPPTLIYLGNEPMGLFTAESHDPDWQQGHRILAPAFGPLSVESMFDGKFALQSVLLPC